MSGDDDGAAVGAVGVGPGAEVGEEVDDRLGAGDVEVREGLVEQEEFWVGLEGAGEGGALAHALGVLGDGAFECGIKGDGAEGHLGGADAVAAALHLVEGGEVAEVFEGGEFVVEGGGVGHVGDASALLGGIASEDLDGALAGFGEAGEEAEEGGFAGAVFAEDEVDLAGVEGEVDGAEGGEGAEELGDRGEAGYFVEGGFGFCGHKNGQRQGIERKGRGGCAKVAREDNGYLCEYMRRRVKR